MNFDGSVQPNSPHGRLTDADQATSTPNEKIVNVEVDQELTN